MSDSGAPTAIRLCPACGRRVPSRVTTCRCGEGLGEVLVRSSGQETGPGKWGREYFLVAGIAIAAAGLWWQFGRSSAQTAPTSAISATTPTPTPTLQADPDPAAGAPRDAVRQTTAADRLTAPGPAIPSIAPTVPAAALPANARAAAPAALEDLVGRVLPAVVLVQTSSGRGSGFFVAPDTIITNAHVAGSDASVTIRRASGETMTARVDRLAPEVDLAVLKTQAAVADATMLMLAPASRIRPGQEVIALGSPLGVLQNTVTRGIVSGVRQMGAVTLVQTDAAINPGNSGGPLVDRQGDVIGITSMHIAGGQGLSFAIAADHARELVEGRRPAIASASTPIAALNQTLQSPGGSSDADVLRTQGTRAFEASLAQLARRADSLDDYWRRFRASCYEGRVAGSFDREWFAVWDAHAMQGAVSPGCGPMWGDVRQQAETIRATVQAADEAARQADVYPGTRRELIKKYRLDFER